jgi:hypothetical protein
MILKLLKKIKDSPSEKLVVFNIDWYQL